MKNLIASISLLLFSLTAISQWTWQNPLPQGNTLKSVYFTDTNTGYAVGYYGTIIKTIDGGEQWTVLNSGTQCILESVYFINPETGFACGGSYGVQKTGIILKTTDGGVSWTQFSNDTIHYLLSICFTDLNKGFVVGEEGTFLKTSDGGITWTSIIAGSINYFHLVYFLPQDDNIGFIAGKNYDLEGLILRTIDGGNTWSPVLTNAGTIRSINFGDLYTGYASEYSPLTQWPYGKIYKTTDGGTTWNIVLESMFISPTSLFFTNSNEGCVIQVTGSILKTIDGGENWSEVQVPSNYPQYSIFFTDNSTGFAVGSRGTIVMTTDGGISWNESPDHLTSQLRSVYFTNATTGFAVGGGYGYGEDDDCILKTTNGGSTWSSVIEFPNINYYLFSVCFTDELTGFASGGGIIKSIDGGNTWYLVYQGNANVIHFVNDSLGYAIGDSEVLKTTNSGDSWIPIETGFLDFYTFVFFTNTNTGYISSFNGVIYKTTNGGDSWTAYQSSASITSLFFTDNNNGYASTLSGNVLVTEDAGTTWNIVFSGNEKKLYSIYFPDSYVGYAVGEDGTIIKTENAGATWQPLSSGTYKKLNSVFFTDVNTGYIVGEEGTILKTSNGGELFITETNLTHSNFSIYPNPATNKISITSNPDISQSVTLNIFKINGQKVLEQNFQNQKQVHLDISPLPKGIYLLKIQSPDKTEIKKLIKN